VKNLDVRQLKEEKEKAISDFNKLQEQLIGVRYIIFYLENKIQEMEKPKGG